MLADSRLSTLSSRPKVAAGIKNIVEYHSNPEAYQDLALGRLDAVVNTEINLRSLIKEKPGVFALGQAGGQASLHCLGDAEGKHRISPR